MPSQHNLIARYLNLKPGAANAVLAAFCCCAVDAVAIRVIADMPVSIANPPVGTENVASSIVSAMLGFSALGGPFFGWLSDHVGRKHTLLIASALLTASILLRGLARNYTELLSLHAVMGFAFAGVWTAGAVLTGEWADPAHRGKTVCLIHCGFAVGWGVTLLLKLLLDALDIPDAWRLMSWLGLAPVVLVYFIWRFVDDAQVFKDTQQPGGLTFAAIGQRLEEAVHLPADFFMRFETLPTWLLGERWSLTFMLSIGAQAGYYAITLRLPHLLPDFLAQAGHKVVSTDWYSLIIVAGSLAGYVAGALASDYFGRRPVFVVSALGSILTVGVLCTLRLDTAEVLVLAPLLVFFSSGVFAGLNAFLTEFFPTRTRGKQQGASYNIGRRVAAYSVLLIVLLDALKVPPWLSILVFVSIAYVFVIRAALLLPETKGRVLTAGDE